MLRKGYLTIFLSMINYVSKERRDETRPDEKLDTKVE